MQYIETYEPPVGGRISSPKFRASLEKSDEFTGLEEDLDKFYALKLIKKVGRQGGFTAELIEMLEYYLIRTSDIDWTEGNKPICYQAVITTAQDLDITERQVRNREKALNALGALSWEDSGNFKRFGVRDRESGQILYAFGVDLSPLASIISTLEQKLEQKKALNELWKENKRKISGLRGRIRTLLAEATSYEELREFTEVMSNEYNVISYSIRSYHTLPDLAALLEKHQLVAQGLLEALDGIIKVADNTIITHDTSPRDEEHCPHIQRTTFPESNKFDYSSPSANSFQKSVAESTEVIIQDQGIGEDSKRSLSQDLSKITWKQMLNACSERFKQHIPIHEQPLEWRDLVDAAHALLPELGIHKTAWWSACQVLGQHGATICVMIIDQKSQDAENPVRNPGGYLRKMTARAKTGDLNLQGSVFGLLKRGEDDHSA